MRKRIAYIGWTEPGDVSGATLALQRHLFNNAEWEVLVITDKPYKGVGSAGNWIELKRSFIHRRLSKTRLRQMVAQYEMLMEPYRFARRIERRVRQFAPDVIHTIPDNTISWVARLLACRLAIPFVCNFQDWWPRGQFHAPYEAPFPITRNVLERRFRIMYGESSVSFCTSEGFKRYLGEHPCSPVLYPCPASRPAIRPADATASAPKCLRLIYGGTLIGDYGRMLLKLARAFAERAHKDIELHLYGGTPDWDASDIEWARAQGIYRGRLSSSEFREKLAEADSCLTVMSHSPELRVMMETSFTTKFLEYCQFAKPVLVWGPSYCEPIRVAKETSAGIPIETNDPGDVIRELLALKDPLRFKKYADGAWNAAITFFDPTSIHEVFRRHVLGNPNSPSVPIPTIHE